MAREERRRGSPPLRIGVDTEWADALEEDEAAEEEESATAAERRRPSRRPPRLAVVQLAVHGRGAWVIDALGHPARRAVGELLRWALNGDPADDDAVAVLGFAFQGDLSVLRPICGGGLHARALVDLQQLARQGREDSQPSLRRVCARTLGKALDKAEQCSDWARRPLLPAQIRYAALDAAVLLDIHDALLKRGEARQVDG